MLHEDENGRLWKVVGPGALLPAEDDDPEVQAFKASTARADALSRAEQARREESLRKRQEAERLAKEREQWGDEREWRRY